MNNKQEIDCLLGLLALRPDVYGKLLTFYHDSSQLDDTELAINAMVLAAGCGDQITLNSAFAAGAKPNEWGTAKVGPAFYLELYSPLRRTIDGHHTKCLELLLQNGADANEYLLVNNQTTIDIMSHSPIMLACSRNYVDGVKLLVHYGAKIEGKALLDTTPLMYAAMNGGEDCVRFLIAEGADLDAVNLEGQTAEAIAIQENELVCAAILRAAKEQKSKE